MRQFLHSVWPFVAVVTLTVVLALQIPRKALFFAPAGALETTPFASMVEYSPEAYGALVRKVRMSWQMRAQSIAPQTENPSQISGLSEELPPPDELEPPAGFFTAHASRMRPATGRPPALLPPTVADMTPLVPAANPPDEEAEARRLRADMLTLPKSLQETE